MVYPYSGILFCHKNEVIHGKAWMNPENVLSQRS
jgi:hypothetical protein